ncbi:hypothetical protein WNY61_07810 [Sulfitobacter sp. AS92]|uniref:hypothetical protein n=1 Tax=Sulfitobacter sp. AS92 TaxID=3135783 RepID=UPI003174B112
MSIVKGLLGLAEVAVRQGTPVLSAEAYQIGFDNARAGNAKETKVMRLKGYQKNSDRPELLKYINSNFTDAYDEGYRDGLMQEELEARRQLGRSSRFE